MRVGDFSTPGIPVLAAATSLPEVVTMDLRSALRSASTGIAVALSFLLFLRMATGAVDPPDRVPSAAAIALSPIGVPEGLVVSKQARARIELRLIESLRGAGWTVLSPAECESTWTRSMVDVGGVFDPETGARDEVRVAAVRRAAFQALAARGLRAWAWPALVVQSVSWSHGRARWHGITETVAPTGAGMVPALSLALRVENAGGDTLFARSAGWGVLIKAGLWNNKLKSVDSAKLLDDEKRLRRALETLQPDLPAPPSGAP